MTDKLRAAAESALEALEQARGASAYVAVGNATENPNLARSTCSHGVFKIDKVEPAIREALAEQETKSVYAFRRKGVSDDFVTCSKARHDELSSKPRLFETAIFYTAPPRREWQSLTDEEIADAIRPLCGENESVLRQLIDFSMDEYRAIEVALKEKNHD